MQYLGCLGNVHVPGRDFIDLEISTLLYTLHSLAAAEQLWDISPPLGLFHASATALLANNKSKCYLCAVLQPTPSSGPKCKPHSLGQEQAAYACCFLYPAGLQALTAALGSPCQDPAPPPSQKHCLPRVLTACLPPALQSRGSSCLQSSLCLKCVCAEGLEKFLFFSLQGVLVLKTKSAEKRVCRFCYWSQAFLPNFVI